MQSQLFCLNNETENTRIVPFLLLLVPFHCKLILSTSGSGKEPRAVHPSQSQAEILNTSLQGFDNFTLCARYRITGYPLNPKSPIKLNIIKIQCCQIPHLQLRGGIWDNTLNNIIMSKELRNGKLKSTDDHKHINDYFTYKEFMKFSTTLIIIGSRALRKRLPMMIRVVDIFISMDENLQQL